MSWFELRPAGATPIAAWRADPPGEARGGIVVIQEIFGVNSHIRAVADRFASQGYLAIAPAIFDRIENGFDVGYDPDSRARGMAAAGRMDFEQALRDAAAAVEAAKPAGKVGIVGYCLGGSIAWAAAGQVPGLSAAVGYYGSRVLAMRDMKLKVPAMLHFGEKDQHIPVAEVEAFAAQRPDVPIYTYPADHGFNCDHRAAYDAPSAALAWDRTLAFFQMELR